MGLPKNMAFTNLGRRAIGTPRKKARQSRAHRNNPLDDSSSNDGGSSGDDSNIGANISGVDPTGFLGRLMRNLTKEQQRGNPHQSKQHTWRVDKYSAILSLMKTQQLLIKILLLKYDKSREADFKIDSISFLNQFDLIIKKKDAGAIAKQVQKITKNFNVTININLFQKFVCSIGFQPRVPQDLGGFTVFMMTPGYQLLTGAMDQPMCNFIAGRDNANKLAEALASTQLH